MMIKCSIAKDLFTAYVSGLGSDDTRELVDEHIAVCEACRNNLAELQNRVAAQLREKDAKSINVFKTMKKKIFRRNVIVGTVVGIVVLFLALTFGIRITREYRIAYSEGLVKVNVNYADYYKNDDNISVVITDPIGNSANSVDVSSNSPVSSGKMAVLDISCTQNYYTYGTGRTIVRNGENVRVEYIYCTESTLSKMKSNKPKNEQIFRLAHADLIGDVPVRYEVYYLTDPRVSDSTISDKEFDDYRHNGTLVWSGTLE